MSTLLPAPGPLGAFLAPWAAFLFILRHPRLWWLCLAPLLVNLGLFLLFFWFSFSRFSSWLDTILPSGQGWWWQALAYLLLVLAVLLLMAMQVLLFAVLGRIIAAPFLEQLTRRGEKLADPSITWDEPNFWSGLGRMLIQESKKLILYFLLVGVLLLLNLVPGLGPALYGALIWLVTCFFLATEFLDYPLERRGLSLRGKLVYVKELKLSGLAFGAAVFILGVVPLLNLAMLPLAALGGTLVYLDNRPPSPPPPPPPGATG